MESFVHWRDFMSVVERLGDIEYGLKIDRTNGARSKLGSILAALLAGFLGGLIGGGAVCWTVLRMPI